jgi:hypothetical protein
MSIARGSFAFRMLYCPQDLPVDALDRFAKNAAPALVDVKDAVSGWVGGRHLLDLPITEENTTCAGFTKLILRKAERKVPAARLKAECAIEEQAQMKATGRPFIPKKERALIKKDIISRLLPTMEPGLSGVEFVYDGRRRMVYTTATSDNQLDVFTANWMKTTGVDVVAVDASTAALFQKQIRVQEWSGTSFSPEVGDESMENTPGEDFLTWLWFRAETGGGIFKDAEGEEFAVQLEGPLLMERKGEGTHETALRKGLPTISDEAKSALLAGKKLARAKVTIVRGGEQWSFGFDAHTFVFRGVKFPEAKEALDADSLFQNRMFNIDALRHMMLHLFDIFVDVRNYSVEWAEIRSQIHAWAQNRTGRK